MRASILRSNERGWVKLLSPFNKGFIDDFKQLIPSSHRRWDVASKYWLVHEDYLDVLIDLLNRYYSEVITDLVDNTESKSTGPYATLFLTDDAPNELIKSAYRLLAMAYHPDRQSGDESKMKLLNQAFDEIKKERKL